MVISQPLASVIMLSRSRQLADVIRINASLVFEALEKLHEMQVFFVCQLLFAGLLGATRVLSVHDVRGRIFSV
jgi:hypothetical protein